jgi:hypothetical protein
LINSCSTVIVLPICEALNYSYASSKGRRWHSIGSLGLLSLQRFGSLYCWRAISREEAKRLFRTGKADVLLCTDAAAALAATAGPVRVLPGGSLPG